MGFKERIHINKRTKQLTIALSKKKIEFLKKHTPRFINIKDWEFTED